MLSNLYWKIRSKGVDWYLRTLYPLLLKHRAKAVGKKDKIEVVFFAINVAMWRYQEIYDLLSKEDRFNCHVVLTSPVTITKNQQIADLRLMRKYFDSLGIEYIDYDEYNMSGSDIKQQINPDILFYPQPYSRMYPANHDFFLFKDKLLCYIPYALNVITAHSWLYNLHFHNLAWKIYCPFEHEKTEAHRGARNHGKNWVVSGYTLLDRYMSEDTHDIWKIKDRSIKRLVWAPHYSMTNESMICPRSNFMWMSQLMIHVAEQYKDRLQIAFKPHPRLRTELDLHPDWGKEKTDNYYQKWESMENTQLETGDFVDLFKTSDAMIHDSASFTVDYLFMNKPTAFVTTDIETIKADHNIFGRDALDQHYIVGNEEEVMSYINDVVLGSQDTLLEQRTLFCENTLKTKLAISPSRFIVDDIKKGLGLT